VERTGKSGPPFHNVSGAPAIGREGTAWKDGRPWRHLKRLDQFRAVEVYVVDGQPALGESINM